MEKKALSTKETKPFFENEIFCYRYKKYIT